MVCLIHGEDCFLSGGGASFFVGRVKLLLLRGGAGGCVAFEPDDVPVSFVSLVVPLPELASSMASRGTFGLRCSLSVGACFLASVSSAGGDYSVSCFLPFLCGRVGVFVLLLFISGDCIADEVSVSYLFLLSCERVEHLGMMCSPVLGGLLCSFIDIMVSGGVRALVLAALPRFGARRRGGGWIATGAVLQFCLTRGCATMVRVTCLSLRSLVSTSDISQPREVS